MNETQSQRDNGLQTKVSQEEMNELHEILRLDSDEEAAQNVLTSELMPNGDPAPAVLWGAEK